MRKPRKTVPGKPTGRDSGRQSSPGGQQSSPASDASKDSREVQRRRRAPALNSDQLTPHEKRELSQQGAPEDSGEADAPADEASRDEARDR